MHTDRPDVVVRPTGTADVAAAVRIAQEYEPRDRRARRRPLCGRSIHRGRRHGDRPLGHACRRCRSDRAARARPGWRGPRAKLDPVDAAVRACGARRRPALADRRRRTDSRRRLRLVAAEVRAGLRQPRLGPGRLRRRRGSHGFVGDESRFVLGRPRRRRRQLRHVTSFTFGLHPVCPIVAFAGVFYPVEAASESLRRLPRVLRRCTRRGPPRRRFDTMPGPQPPGADSRSPVSGGRCGLRRRPRGRDGNSAAVARVASPLADISQPMPFTAVQSAFDGFFPRGQSVPTGRPRTSRLSTTR